MKRLLELLCQLLLLFFLIVILVIVTTMIATLSVIVMMMIIVLVLFHDRIFATVVSHTSNMFTKIVSFIRSGCIRIYTYILMHYFCPFALASWVPPAKRAELA